MSQPIQWRGVVEQWDYRTKVMAGPTGAMADLLAVASGAHPVIVDSIGVYNDTGGTLNFQLQVVTAAGATIQLYGTANQVATKARGEMYSPSPGKNGLCTLNAGDKIQGFGSGALSLTINYRELK